MPDENGGGVAEGAERELDIDQILAENQKLKTKVNEFRNNNIELTKKWESADPILKEHEQLKSQLEEARREAMKAKGDVEGVFKSQLEEMKANSQREQERLRRELEEHKTAREQAVADRKNLVFSDKLRRSALEVASAEKEYLDYIISDAARVFELDENDELVPRSGMMNPKTMEEWTLETWLIDHRDKKPKMYQGSTGGGAIGGSKMVGGKHVLTPEQADRPTAEQLKIIQSGNYVIRD